MIPKGKKRAQGCSKTKIGEGCQKSGRKMAADDEAEMVIENYQRRFLLICPKT